MTNELAESFLWRHGSKFILMSASFYPRPILAKCLGIDIDDMDYFNVPSQFPVSNRPIYVAPVVNMTAKTTDAELPKLITEVTRIIDSYLDVKGIIHCVSYSLASKIMASISNPRLITHNTADRQTCIDMFISSNLPYVLVSPSLERGVSLDEDKCRFIIIVKAPYLSLADKITSLRLFSSGIGQAWYTSTMLLTILQMAGRGVRSKSDQADTYILDLQAKNAITKNPSYLPEWFLDAIQFSLPELK
jgi:ATP-dependent DNA helicase DinG